jgi:hypothetical protein
MQPTGDKVVDSFGLCACAWTRVWTRGHGRACTRKGRIRGRGTGVYAEEVYGRVCILAVIRVPPRANGSCGFWSGHFYTRIEVEKTILPLAAE